MERVNTPDWKNVVKVVAPTLATVLGGPLAGTAVTALSEALFGKPNASEADIAGAVLTADPALLLKLKQADHAFAEKMAVLELNYEKIAQADRADARTRQIATNDITPAVLAIVVTSGFFGLLGALFFWVPPSEAETVLQIMLGALGASYLAIINYYFGSSSGSKEKTQMFGKMQEVSIRKAGSRL